MLNDHFLRLEYDIFRKVLLWVKNENSIKVFVSAFGQLGFRRSQKI